MARRHIKTKHGISTKGIRTKKQSPLYGIGQGNGGGPAIWLAHLTIMFTALSTLCYGLIVAGIKKLEELNIIGTGYVDDVTIVVSVNKRDPQTLVCVKSKVKTIASKWEKLLYITGGKLELSKCFWIPITWGWKRGKLHIKKPDGRNRDLYLRESESGNLIKIPLLKPTDAPKRLGIRYSIDGSWNAEYKHWRQFTDSFTKTVRMAQLDRIGGYHVYAMLWCSKFRYSSPCLGFTSNRLEVITKKVMGPCLSAAGYSSKMPRAVVFGPSTYGGMQWETPLSILLTSQLTMLIGSIRLDDIIGKLILIQLEWIQLVSGLGTPILEYTKIIDYIPSGWIQNLHRLLVETGLQVKIDNSWRATKRRVKDDIIMEYVQ